MKEQPDIFGDNPVPYSRGFKTHTRKVKSSNADEPIVQSRKEHAGYSRSTGKPNQGKPEVSVEAVAAPICDPKSTKTKRPAPNLPPEPALTSPLLNIPAKSKIRIKPRDGKLKILTVASQNRPVLDHRKLPGKALKQG